MSARETILAAVATALSGVASGRVYRGREEQIKDLPAVLVTLEDGDGAEGFIGQMDHRAGITITVLAKGDIPDSAIDSTLAAAWSALCAASSLNSAGTQIAQRYEINWDVENYDNGRAQMRININYTTALGAM